MAYDRLERFQPGDTVLCLQESFLAPWVEKGREYLVLSVNKNQYARCSCGGAGDQHHHTCNLVAQMHPDNITIQGPEDGQEATLNGKGFEKKKV